MADQTHLAPAGAPPRRVGIGMLILSGISAQAGEISAELQRGANNVEGWLKPPASAPPSPTSQPG